MEKERIEAIEVELDLAIENFESAADDINAQRFRRATSGLYFTLLKKQAPELSGKIKEANQKLELGEK